MWILCQNAKQDYMTLVMYGFILIFAILGLFVVVLWFRKKTLNSGSEKPNGGFLLSDLRKLRDEGKMTPLEYEKAKAAIVGQTGVKEKEKPPQGPKNGSVG